MELIQPQQEYASLPALLREKFGPSVTVREAVPVPGGDINRAYCLRLSGGQQIFLKTNSVANVNFFRTEAGGLAALRASGKIGVPRLLGLGVDVRKGCAFLALEYVETAPPGPAYWETFGRQLAALHRWDCAALGYPAGDAGRYGFWEDNYIGATPQRNTPMGSWVAFYRDCRLLPQLTLAEGYLEPGLRRRADWLLEHLERYLREPESPSLVHGDLWQGNILGGPDGRAWLIDPAAYVGDFETDLAMTQLFGSLPERCYRAYGEVNPLDLRGYRERRPLYHLYHLLNHLNLFGPAYLGGVEEILRRYGGGR